MIIGLIGVSGVGKSFLRINAQQKFMRLNYLKSVTTRPRRANETDGVDKYFVTDEEFNVLCANHEMLLQQTIYGYKYAFKISDVVNMDSIYITEMLYSDVAILKQFTRVISINIISKDLEIIRKNLLLRYAKSLEAEKRLNSDADLAQIHEKLAQADFFDYQFENHFDDASVVRFNTLIASIIC